MSSASPDSLVTPAIEESAFAGIVPTHDAGEGVAAFVEKRHPIFLGR